MILVRDENARLLRQVKTTLRFSWLAAVLLLVPLHAAMAAGAEAPTKSPLSQDPGAQARQFKQTGDLHTADDELDKAADAYIKALDLSRSSFSSAERLLMATRLSWADRLARSESELRNIVASEPGNLDARLRLARVLSWRGELTDAIEQADQVLRQSPENREAQQIRADALQWKGELRNAITLYDELIKKQDDFDARLGLSYSFLYGGDRLAAAQTSRLLKPATTNEQDRFSKFQDIFDSLTRPKLDMRYLYFNDSDGVVLDRYSLQQNFWINNYDLAAGFRHTEARDNTGQARAEEFSLKAYTRPTVASGIGGSLGFANLGNGNSTNFLTGDFKLDARITNLTLGASVTREVLTDSAELIHNRIRAISAGLQTSWELTDRISLQPGYRYRSFSDVNHAHEASFTSQYLLLFNPKLAIGHRFRYENFHRQSGSGYFDPSDYYSNRAFATYYIDREKYYFFADIFAGHQNFRRNRVISKDPVYGGAASVGYRPIRNLIVEFYVEGGQLASATSSGSGYSYLQLGPRLLIRF